MPFTVRMTYCRYLLWWQTTFNLNWKGFQANEDKMPSLQVTANIAVINIDWRHRNSALNSLTTHVKGSRI